MKSSATVCPASALGGIIPIVDGEDESEFQCLITKRGEVRDVGNVTHQCTTLYTVAVTASGRSGSF